MAAVYSQSHVVLAADRAMDSTAGMFHMRNVRPAVVVAGVLASPVHLQLLFPGEDSHLLGCELDGEPLGKRCWALQERVLATRVLHFGHRQMYYECSSSGLVGENGWHEMKRSCHVCRLDDNDTSDQDALRLWHDLILNYAQRKLSSITDKLPAMSGLARLMADRGAGLGRKYVAGLWSDRLIEELAWKGFGGQQPAPCYIGPSWSWASFDGKPEPAFRHSHFLDRKWHDIAEAIEWRVVLENEDEVNRHRNLSTKYSQDGKGDLVCPDYEDLWPPEHEDTYALILAACRDRDGSLRLLFALVLVPVGEDKQEPCTMKRVGWMTFCEDCERILSDSENRTVVTLI